MNFQRLDLSRTLKRFEGVCPTNLLDFSELGTFGLANWQNDKATTLNCTVDGTQSLKYVEKKRNYTLGGPKVPERYRKLFLVAHDQ